MQFTGTVKRFDPEAGVGYIVRYPDRHEVVVRSKGLALGVDTLYEGDESRSTSTRARTRRRETSCAAEDQPTPR